MIFYVDFLSIEFDRKIGNKKVILVFLEKPFVDWRRERVSKEWKFTPIMGHNDTENFSTQSLIDFDSLCLPF
jgi:hypothetical protein